MKQKVVDAAYKSQEPLTKVYKTRWLILALYIFYGIASSVQIMQYSVIADVAVDYYQVSFVSIDWTSMIVSLVSVVTSFPGSYIVEKLGIRISVIIGAVGTCIGAWLKCIAVNPDRFWLVLLSQAEMAIFQSCSGPLLPKITAAWFGANEISRACAIGLIGGQVGFSLSFLLPPLMVYKDNVEVIGQSMYNISLIYSIYSSIIVVLVVLLFKNEPPLPPSIAQENLIQEKKANPTSVLQICKNIITNRSYILFLIIFGINMGIVNSMQVLSNQVILSYYPTASEDVGIIGLLQSFLSLIGTFSVSIVLDKFKKFKEATWISYALYLVTIVLYIATLDQGLPFVYATSILNGISMGTLLTLAMEVIVEFTYPEPENITVGLAFSAVQIVTIASTFLYGHMFRTIGIVWANITLVLILLASDLLFFLIKFNLKRQAVQNAQKSEVVLYK